MYMPFLSAEAITLSIFFATLSLYFPIACHSRGKDQGEFIHIRARLQPFALIFANALSKPLMSYLLAIMFIMSFAFSAFPVIMPLLAISFFDFTEPDMFYFFVYFGLVQIIFQGFIMGRLSKRINEEKMIVMGSLLMTISVFLMSLFPNLAIFLGLTTIMMAGGGMLQTSIPSFISKRTIENETGGVLGVVQSISAIARVPGPLIGGLLYELAGLNAPFQFSAFLLMLAMLLGLKIVQSIQASKQQP